MKETSFVEEHPKIVWAAVILAVLVAIGLLVARVASAHVSHENGQVQICHYTQSHYVINTPNKSGNVGGHDGHSHDIIPPFDYWQHFGGNPGTWLFLHYFGKNWNTQGQAIWRNNCEVPQPSPTPTLTPTPSPTGEPTPTPTVGPSPTPTPTPEDGCKEDCQKPTPTPTPPAETPFPQPQKGTSGDPGAPQCPNGDVLVLPINFFVIRNGSEAQLKWVPTAGDQVSVFYRVTGHIGWEFALADQPNNGDLTIHALNPSLGYDWGLMQHQGCSGGLIALSRVIDPPAVGRIFLSDGWEWSK